MIAKRALQENCSVADLVLELGLMDQETLEKILSPEVLTRPGIQSTK